MHVTVIKVEFPQGESIENWEWDCRTLLEDFTSWHSLIPNLLFSRGSLLPTISYHPVRMYAGHVRNSCKQRCVCVVQREKPVPTEHSVTTWWTRVLEERESSPLKGWERGERERETLRGVPCVRGLHTYIGCLRYTIF